MFSFIHLFVQCHLCSTRHAICNILVEYVSTYSSKYVMMELGCTEELQSILVLAIVMFYEVTTNTESANTEPLLLREVQG